MLALYLLFIRILCFNLNRFRSPSRKKQQQTYSISDNLETKVEREEVILKADSDIL